VNAGDPAAYLNLIGLAGEVEMREGAVRIRLSMQRGAGDEANFYNYEPLARRIRE
jgi:hypothetical protein